MGLMRSFVFLLGLSFVAGCRLTEPLPLDLVEAKRVVAEAVPKGTSVEEARRRMEKRGFRCRIIEPPIAARPYLSCYTTGPGLIVVRQWGVTFSIEDGKVGEGIVSTDLLGP